MDGVLCRQCVEPEDEVARNHAEPAPGIQGVNRQATAVAVAEFAIQTLGWNPAHINLARGDVPADAISAAPHAGEELGPLLFTLSPNQLGTATAGFLRAHAGTITSIDVLGGPAAVSDAVVAQARVAASG